MSSGPEAGDEHTWSGGDLRNPHVLWSEVMLEEVAAHLPQGSGRCHWQVPLPASRARGSQQPLLCGSQCVVTSAVSEHTAAGWQARVTSVQTTPPG